MKVYRYTKTGYCEMINTDGAYKPKGWYISKKIAFRYRNKRN